MFGSLQKKDDLEIPSQLQQKIDEDGASPPPPPPPIEQLQMPIQMQQQQMPMQMQQQQMPLFDQMLGPPKVVKNKKQVRVSGSSYIKEINFSDIDPKLEVVSVIVTTHHGSSYDNLFRQVPQKLPWGRVSLFSLETHGIKQLLDLMRGKGKVLDKTVGNFMKEVEQLDPDCVLFNWECCEGCSDSGFQSNETIELIELLISKGHMLMFSDFAVKALIGKWDSKRLGPKPFVKIGECSTSIELNFVPKTLEECGIPQLEAVAKLCEKGTASLHCLGGTIVVGVDWKNVKKSKNYTLEILTVAGKVDGRKPSKSKNLCKIGNTKGTVGHAVLRYKEGGELIVSAGHWIELSKLDTSVERVEQWAEQYGNEYAEDIMYLKSSNVSMESKRSKMKEMTSMFVQQMPSCKQKKSNF